MLADMRSLYRTTLHRRIGSRLARDVALVCLADAVVALSFGAITVGAGLPAWLPVLLSLVVFAGASQFLLVGVVASGGSLAAAVAAGLLVNARHVPFGFAVADSLGGGLGRRLAGSHLMTDESVAFAVAEPDPARRTAAYWVCGLAVFVSFNLAVVPGVVAGRALGDPATWGLDAAFPAVLLALVLPALRDAVTRRAALAGAAIALATSPVLPAGLPVLLALLPLAVTVRTREAA